VSEKTSVSGRWRITQPSARPYPRFAPSKIRSVDSNSFPCSTVPCALSRRLQSIGVSVSDTNPDTSTATMMVIANSRNSRPMMPPMNISGMNTEASDSVMERIV
jgi:hypothetical protein